MSEKLNVLKVLTGASITNAIAMLSIDDLDIWIKIISTLAAAIAAGFAAYNYYQSGRLKRIEADRLEGKIEESENANSES